MDMLTHRTSFKYTYSLLAFLLTVYLLDNLVFGPVVGGLLGNHLLPSLAWLFLFIFILWLPGVYPAGKLRLRKVLRWLALICVFIAVLSALLQGFMGGFGKSPYDRSLLGVIVNFITLGTVLVATEFSRSWLLNRFFHKRPFFGVPLISFFFAFLSFPIIRLTTLDNPRAAVEFAGGTFFPAMAENFLMTYFAFLGGPVPAIIYQGGLLAFERLSPILPSGGWAAQILLGVMAPVLGLMLVREIYLHESRKLKPSSQDEGYLGWVFTSVAVILVIWFSVGIFSVFPKVIISGSMVPVIDIGDVVIIRELAGEEVQLGDIILFPMYERKLVVHRVIDIQHKDGQTFFETKGDANDSPDGDLLLAANVQGEVIMTVPKVGWITLALRGAVR